MRRLVLALLLLAGCGSAEERAAQAPPALERTPWVLASGIDVDGWEQVAPSATFADGTLSGSDGCNRYSTSYTAHGDALELGTVAGTRMACVGPADEVSQAFNDALALTARWRIEDDELTLLDEGGGELLRLREASPLGSWRVTSFLQGDAVTGPIDGTEITATFADGIVTGNGGCNLYTAPFTLAAGALTITPPVVTKTRCVLPGLMEQEARYLKALPQTASYAVDGSTLTLLTRAGTIVATYTRTG